MMSKINVSKIILALLVPMLWATPAFAHSSPVGCTGSGLGISLFSSLTQVNIGDTISYSAVVFNGSGSGPVVCDADGITASIVTPDGVNHPITLTRTTLLNGQSDTYLNVVTYVASIADINPTNGILAATASDTGVIHQNVTDSAGGANQGLNVFVLNTLHIIKQVVNTTGGTAVASDFSLHVKKAGVDIVGSPAVGIGTPGTLYSIIGGTYTVSEDTNASYTATFSGDCNASGTVTVIAGNNKICTVTNTHIAPATITVVKVVVNDNGGTKTITDFPLHINAITVLSGVPSTVPAPLTYTVTETGSAGYTQAFSGDCNSAGIINLVPGDNKVCTITNNDIPPAAATINVIKTVINDNGGTKTIADFPLFVNGGLVVSGVTNTFPANATYTVTETASAGYTQAFSGDCDATGHVSLVPGDHKICIITNNDILVPTGGGGPVAVPPIIDVVKVPNPLALPNGPGSVEYTYTVRNIGTVPMTTVTMVGDTCSPIILQSGDTNNNGALDLTETWVYTCTTTLTATHTNTIVATGWAGGISAVDVASSTVVVGVPGLPETALVPPLIHVTKVPNPLRLQVGGGLVTYTERITNPGTVPLSSVTLTDDKCGPMNFVSGDTNADSMLNASETWTYTCTTRLTTTTTNTAVATGQGNGFFVRDFAIATVVVPAIIPLLPNTGLPVAQNAPWNIVILGVLMLVSISFAVLKKHTI